MSPVSNEVPYYPRLQQAAHGSTNVHTHIDLHMERNAYQHELIITQLQLFQSYYKVIHSHHDQNADEIISVISHSSLD